MRKFGFSSLAMMSGWLFADLLLVLFLTVLSSSAGGNPIPIPTESATPSPSVSPSASVSPKPTPTKKPCAQSFELRPQQIIVDDISLSGLRSGNTAARNRLKQVVQKEIRERKLQNQFAGLVLAFGYAPNANRTLARAAALEAGQMLKADLPRFERIQIREFSFETSETNRVRLDVYFFVRC
ncbi:hypothetical protein ACQP2E_12125 [Actinoplanes sp. CA-015351]|uniref:hypothetical protein n=1 Tax=Actinoplanes sp. CA-015351 TaxID=3239897 RepID=UPI003D983DCF